MTREFDLNIERVLEHWTVVHALREVIANALDEHSLTRTAEPKIFRDDVGRLHVRDFGRGLRYEHLTQNESEEKQANPDRVVGKFGVGLKDALATLDRHQIRVTVHSAHAEFTTALRPKGGFPDVATLHALIESPSEPQLIGTDFVLEGNALGDKEVDEAKALFLHYAGDEVLDSTAHGQVLRTGGETARIYVNGLRVAYEENFLFSYNITSTTKALRQALNRERSHVGRAAYTDRVKSIMLASKTDEVVEALVDDLRCFEEGAQHDETGWVDIGLHACRQLNARRKVIFLTPSELREAPEFLRRAEDDGYEPVIVPESLRNHLPNLRDAAGNAMRDLDRYCAEWTESFRFDFVDPTEFTDTEREVWDELDAVFASSGSRPHQVKRVLVSSTMRLQASGFREAAGLWEPAEGCIIVRRDQLSSLGAFAGTVLHEVAHAISGAPDVSPEFEEALTAMLGTVAARQIAASKRREA